MMYPMMPPTNPPNKHRSAYLLFSKVFLLHNKDILNRFTKDSFNFIAVNIDGVKIVASLLKTPFVDIQLLLQAPVWLYPSPARNF